MDSPPKQIDTVEVLRKDVFHLLKGKLNEDASTVFALIEKYVAEQTKHPFALNENDKPQIRKLMHDLRSRWQKVTRREELFLEKYKDWLSICVSLQVGSIPKTSMQKGRPEMPFLELSERAKRRRTENIRSEASVEELAFATQMSLRASGNIAASKVVKEVGLGDPSTAENYRRSVNAIPESQMSADAALSLLIEQKLSKGQYQGLRNAGLEHNSKLYPPYRAVYDAKLKCYPSMDDMNITESCAEVKLQSLLDHTVGRILLSQQEVIKSLTSDSVSKLNLIVKWGCDGSSGQSNYKQSFSDESKSDSCMFLTSLVPLEVVTSEQLVIWKNPRPSSPRYCRPIRIRFLHENVENTLTEIEYIQEQQKNLIPYEVLFNEKPISVTYDLALTMIDGKVCNAITGNSSTQRCNICDATSKQFNNIDNVLKKEVKEENFQYGISSLHAWIRFFVDQPKHGYGSTNDGNTARRFFENHEISASITGIDEDLIKRFYIILQTISSGHDINIQRFEEYALATARKFVDLYPWFYMPTSVHKVLLHGGVIISAALLPIGQMSEDAQESCNKYIKRFREDYARKCSRKKTMEDVFCRLLASSEGKKITHVICRSAAPFNCAGHRAQFFS